ncbi:flagellar protein FliT [Clostridium chromiireducens]|uniref:Flagellar protein FliT n=1 Tax=Clostridium chromiireducens TaxID=225345 RepID=A0A399IZN5_9CLOT|nr:flagellar protein FliT [Clostridium chromiireducens]RII36196.1 flagellar protein FliT [Clostridium chromiireducens]
MNEKLKSYLEDFKKCTIEMIEDLEKDDLDNFEAGLNRRQQIIEKISELNFDKNEFKEICKQLDVETFDNELNKRTKDEKDKLRQKILNLKKSQSANTVYQSNTNKINIFSKKV